MRQLHRQRRICFQLKRSCSNDATIVSLGVTTADKFKVGLSVWVMAIDNEDGSIGSPAAAIGTADVEPPF
jgi:hypothetical protein